MFVFSFGFWAYLLPPGGNYRRGEHFLVDNVFLFTSLSFETLIVLSGQLRNIIFLRKVKTVTYVKSFCFVLYDFVYFADMQGYVVSTSLFHIPCRSRKHHSITKGSIKNLFHEHAVIKESFFVFCSHVSVQQGTFDFPIFQRCSNFIQVAILVFC